jgi:hypothetical protein
MKKQSMMYVHKSEVYVSIWQQQNSHRCQKSEIGGGGGVVMEWYSGYRHPRGNMVSKKD